MSPAAQYNVIDEATQLEQWSALVESFEKYGRACSLPVPCRVAALRVTMTRGGDWFDDWQQDCFKMSELLNVEYGDLPETLHRVR
eukprot:2647716-Pyramimonas_sp.AAC.1